MQAYFEGLYFKQQNEKESVALIPAVHVDGRGRRSASLQIVTDEGAHQIWYEGMEAVISRAQNRMAVGKSVFSPEGLVLDAEGGGVRAFGRVCFEGVTPLGYDIMGPFCLVPGMECRHKVVSMRHRVQGELNINGRRYVFDDGAGYLEGDRGCSFPSRYVWTQCISREPSCSIMLAAASIPTPLGAFTGAIGVVLTGQKQYRLATYLGARVRRGGGSVCVRQGGLELTAELLEKNDHALSAPVSGEMVRLIRESVACTVRYRFSRDKVPLLDFVSRQASFEWEDEEYQGV